LYSTQERRNSTVVKDYQEEVLRYLWGLCGDASSCEVWVQVNKDLVGTQRGSISRASIINFLNDMVDGGVLK